MCSMSIILCYNMFKLFSSSFWHPSQSVDLSVNRRISRSNIFVVSIPKCLWFFIHSHTIYLIQCVQECRGNRYGYLFRVVSNTQKKGGVYLHIPFFTEERSNICSSVFQWRRRPTTRRYITRRDIKPILLTWTYNICEFHLAHITQ